MMELNLTRLDYLQVREAIFDRLPWIRILQQGFTGVCLKFSQF